MDQMEGFRPHGVGAVDEQRPVLEDQREVAPGRVEIGAGVIEQRQRGGQWRVGNGRERNVDCVVVGIFETLEFLFVATGVWYVNHYA